MLSSETIGDLVAWGRELEDTHFDCANKCNDWRNHVEKELIAVWRDLSDEARGAVYYQAEAEAGREYWE